MKWERRERKLRRRRYGMRVSGGFQATANSVRRSLKRRSK